MVELDAYLLSGRLTGMLFADQGAEVVILTSGKEANSKVTKLTDGDEICEKRASDMLNRKVLSLLFSKFLSMFCIFLATHSSRRREKHCQMLQI